MLLNVAHALFVWFAIVVPGAILTFFLAAAATYGIIQAVKGLEALTRRPVATTEAAPDWEPPIISQRRGENPELDQELAELLKELGAYDPAEEALRDIDAAARAVLSIRRLKHDFADDLMRQYKLCEAEAEALGRLMLDLNSYEILHDKPLPEDSDPHMAAVAELTRPSGRRARFASAGGTEAPTT